jgi:hypothetical protein
MKSGGQEGSYLLDKKHTDKVILLTGLVNRDSAKSAQQDVVQQVVVQHSVRSESHDVLIISEEWRCGNWVNRPIAALKISCQGDATHLDGRHDLGSLLLVQRQDPVQNGNLVIPQRFGTFPMELQEGLQFGLSEAAERKTRRRD